MKPKKYDVVVVGGGPAGAAAAWRAAVSGADVLCVDKATFPRPKACGDGLTPRAVSLISEMGLGADLERFHPVAGARFFGKRSWQLTWPDRPGLPPRGYVASRLELDEMLLGQAAQAGAEIRQSSEAIAPLMINGRIGGVVVRQRSGGEETVVADALIAADGAYSPLRRAIIGPDAPVRGSTAIAIRAEMDSARCESPFLEFYTRISYDDDALPGYAWLFPLGNGRINCGVGYLMTYRKWHDVNAVRQFGQFLNTLPSEWELPTVADLQARKAIGAWRIPMAFTGPTWRPGVLFAGDAAGSVKPSTGAGISRALQSGMAAATSALDALTTTGPSDFSNYEHYLTNHWGRTYRWGRRMHKLAGNPRVMTMLCDILDSPPIRRAVVHARYGSAGAALHREGPLPSIEVEATPAAQQISDQAGYP